MNYEELETVLLEIIKEAEHLDESELEVVPGTDIKVKKGRAKEFENRAYNFYELGNNVLITEDTPYITETYKMLKDKVNEENKEYYEGISYDISSLTKDNINTFGKLKAALIKAKDDYNKLKEMQNNIKSESVREGLTKDLDSLEENVDIIVKRLNELKNEINNVLISNIDKELENIRKNYLNTRIGTKIAASQDGTMILEADLEEYNNLYALKNILNNVKENDLYVSAYGLAIVNEHQKEIFEGLISKTNLFKHLEPKKEEPKGLNDSIIKTIMDRLSEIEHEVPKTGRNIEYVRAVNDFLVVSDYLLEYNSLIGMLKYLNQAKNMPENMLRCVWGIGYVSAMDADKFEELMKNVPEFSRNNPLVEKVEHNLEEIKKIDEKLKEIEHKYNSYQGISNIPAVLAADGTIILQDDAKEYNALLDIKKMLTNIDGKNIVNIQGVGYVKAEDVNAFNKALLNSSLYSDVLPKHEENEKREKEIINELQELIEKAKKTQDAVMADGKEVLKEDEEKYDALNEMYNILKASEKSLDVEEIDGVKIAKPYVDAYKKAKEKYSNVKPLLPPKKTNEDKIKEIYEEIEELKKKAEGKDKELLADNGLVLKEDEKKYDDLTEMAEYLTLGMEDVDTVEIDGLKIPSAHVERYKTVAGIKTNYNAQKKDEITEEINKLKEKAKDKDKELLDENGIVLKSDREKYDELSEMLNYVNQGENIEDGVVIDGVTIPREYEKRYRELSDKFKPTKPTLPGKDNKRKKVISVRGIGKKLGEFCHNHKKAIIGTILTVAIAALGLQVVGPALVCANCSFAYAVPGLSGLFNGLNSLIAPLCGLHAAPISGPVTMFATKLGGIVTAKTASATLLPSLLSASLGVGALGFGTYKLGKYVKSLAREGMLRGAEEPEEIKESKLTEIKNRVKGLWDGLKKGKKKEEPTNNPALTEEEKVKRDLIQKRIDERIKNLQLSSNNFIKIGKDTVTPPVMSENLPDRPPVKLTMPTDEEILEELDDGKLNIARAEALVDSVGKEKTKEIRDIRKELNKITEIDMSSYSMNNIIDRVRYIIDVAKRSNASIPDIIRVYEDGINEIQKNIDVTSDDALRIKLEEELNNLNNELKEYKSSLANERGL